MDSTKEESKSSAPIQAMSSVKIEGKPTFEQVISCQASSGNWTKHSLSVLYACIAGNNYQDSAVQVQLDNMTLTEDREIVYITLMALFILREAFAHREDEHVMICQNAKVWLTAAGVQKPDKLVRKFTLPLVQWATSLLGQHQSN